MLTTFILIIIMIIYLYLVIFITNTEKAVSWSLNPFLWFRRIKECRLNVNSDLNHEHEPIFLIHTSNGYELAIPQIDHEEGVFKLYEKENLYVACPGRGNKLRSNLLSNIDTSLSLATECVDRKTLKVGGKEVQSSEIECRKTIFTTLKETNNVCGNYAGKEIQLGFEANQRSVFTQLLGNSQADYILARSYLSRGHLSPGRDFLLRAWQHLTYFYVNAAPQWQTINVGNWLRLESLLRTVAASAQQDFIITTGTYGILELTDSDGFSKKIFLEPSYQLMPVPLLFWKVVADPYKKSCIVFLVHNNPFLNNRPNTICENICHKYGWPTDMDNVLKGYTYCCSYDDFKSIVDIAPDINCKTILQNDLV